MIIGVAIRHEGRIYSLAGKHQHDDLISYMAEAGVPAPAGGERGFFTDNGEFLNREEAAAYAFDCGQINRAKLELFSGDLW